VQPAVGVVHREREADIDAAQGVDDLDEAEDIASSPIDVGPNSDHPDIRLVGIH